jgi:hypothetical protein
VGIAVVSRVMNLVLNQGVLALQMVVEEDTVVAKQTDYTYYTGPYFSALVIVVSHGPRDNRHYSPSGHHHHQHRTDLQTDHMYYTDSKQVAR